MDIRGTVKEALARALGSVGVSVETQKITLEHPAELKNGDYSSGVALQYAKQASMAPRALAGKIVEELRSSTTLGPTSIQRIEVAGAGFINFYLAPSELSAAVETARKEDMWGSNKNLAGKKIMVEYTDPNPFKEFHIGHLMSNAIGESIARLLEFSGAEVKRANYQGDVGPHVAKAIFTLNNLPDYPNSLPDKNAPLQEKSQFLGSAYAMGADAYEQGYKEQIDALNKVIYEVVEKKTKNSKLQELYEWGRAVSLEHFEEIYKKLGTKFDNYFFESETAQKGLALVKAHPEVFEESDGAVVYKGEQDGLHTRVFITSKGLPTYETKELGLAELKAEKCPVDVSITVTAHEQSDYFRVVLAAMSKVLPDIAAKIQHISHGMMRFAEGKMSSRTGNVITGESLIADLTEAAKVRAAESRADDADKLAQDIAVAAIKYQILKQASGKDIIFDRQRALSLEGDSGPYLQYAHARAHQLVEKARSQNVDMIYHITAEPNDLVRLLHRFPEAVEYAAAGREPHLFTNYLLEFAASFNSWYAQVHVLDGTPDAAHKVALVDAVRRTLKNGLWILGIPAPEKM